jgi:hypothetical protein
VRRHRTLQPQSADGFRAVNAGENATLRFAANDEIMKIFLIVVLMFGANVLTMSQTDQSTASDVQRATVRPSLAETPPAPVNPTDTMPQDRPKPKDGWDKIQAVGPVLVTLLVALVGGLLTRVYSSTQEKRATAERRVQDERASAERQAAMARDELFRQNQLQLTRIQTVQGFLAYLSKGEVEKKAAILAIQAIGDPDLASELAKLFQSPGAVDALAVIARSDASRPALAALAAINSTESAEALSRLYEEARSALGLLSGPARSEMSRPTLLLAAVAIGPRSALVLASGVVEDSLKFIEPYWGPFYEIKSRSSRLGGLALMRVEDVPSPTRPVKFGLVPTQGAPVVAVGFDQSGTYVTPTLGSITGLEENELTVSFQRPVNQVAGSLLLTTQGDAVGLLSSNGSFGDGAVQAITAKYYRGDRIRQFLDLS